MSPFEGRSLACIRGGRRVFEGLDFDLPAGGALLLTGPNGSGKSSLLRLMAGFLGPGEGTLSWNGEPAQADPEAHRSRVQFLGHLDAVKLVLTARESSWQAARRKEAAITGKRNMKKCGCRVLLVVMVTRIRA